MVKRRAVETFVALVVVGSMGVSACGGDSQVKTSGASKPATASSDGSSATSDTVAGEVGGPELDQSAAAMLAMSGDQQEAYLNDLALKFERQLAAMSGLEAALGGPEATDVALREAWAPIIEKARAIKAAPLSLGFRTATPASGPNIGEGLFGGLILVMLGSQGVVTATNDAKPGEKPVTKNEGDITLVGSLDKASIAMDTTHNSSQGVTTKFKSKAEVLPCPDAKGQFKATALIDISATKGSVGQTGTMDISLDGQVDDNAALVSSDVGFRMQWADFAGGKGQFVDVKGSYSGSNFNGLTLNRSGGNVTADFYRSAVMIGALFGLMLATKLGEAAQKGWESGRCVKLDAKASPGPKGLEPSSTSTITAAPRSKIDGGPVGGTVTATLTSGGVSVDPSAAPVPADATMTYTAPDQPNQGGTVSLEARSKRGVAKAEIAFETGGAAYLIVGGLEDWQVNQVVCDVMKPFVLTTGIGSMTLSGGLSGTYEFNGAFNSHYTGTYQITLPPGPGLPGSMIGAGGGSIASQAGSGSENYVLTPADPC